MIDVLFVLESCFNHSMQLFYGFWGYRAKFSSSFFQNEAGHYHQTKVQIRMGLGHRSVSDIQYVPSSDLFWGDIFICPFQEADLVPVLHLTSTQDVNKMTHPQHPVLFLERELFVFGKFSTHLCGKKPKANIVSMQPSLSETFCVLLISLFSFSFSFSFPFFFLFGGRVGWFGLEPWEV